MSALDSTLDLIRAEFAALRSENDRLRMKLQIAHAEITKLRGVPQPNSNPEVAVKMTSRYWPFTARETAEMFRPSPDDSRRVP